MCILFLIHHPFDYQFIPSDKEVLEKIIVLEPSHDNMFVFTQFFYKNGVQFWGTIKFIL